MFSRTSRIVWQTLPVFDRRSLPNRSVVDLSPSLEYLRRYVVPLSMSVVGLEWLIGARTG